MDLIGGLSAAKLAIDIAKDLRSIDRSVDDATFKLKLAELTMALADAQLALSEAKVKIGELEGKISSIEDGKICPKCRVGRLLLIATESMSMGGLGRFGVQEWEYKCNNSECGFTIKEVIDPQGLVPKHLAKR